MRLRKKPEGFSSPHDKIYFRKTLKYVKIIMKHFNSYKDEEDGN